MSKQFERFDLTGRVALITGAAGLLGREHAIALLKSGATVVLTDIDDTALVQNQSRLMQTTDESRLLAQVMDVTSLGSIEMVAEELATVVGGVDILVNNAAIDSKVTAEGDIVESSRLENFSLAEWDSQLAVGLTGAFLCSKVFGSLMANKRRGGVILNIASDLSVMSPYQALYQKVGLANDEQPVKPVTYSVIKAGLVGLTRYLSTYWADYGVRANALSPGGVFDNQGEDFVEHLSSLIPLGRMARHDEYQAAVQFLCSDASSYLNGQNIVMDGGRSVW